MYAQNAVQMKNECILEILLHIVLVGSRLSAVAANLCAFFVASLDVEERRFLVCVFRLRLVRPGHVLDALAELLLQLVVILQLLHLSTPDTPPLSNVNTTTPPVSTTQYEEDFVSTRIKSLHRKLKS